MIQNFFSNIVHNALLAYKYFLPPCNFFYNHVDLNIWQGSLPYNRRSFDLLKKRNIKYIFSIMTDEEMKNIELHEDFNQIKFSALDCSSPTVEQLNDAVKAILNIQNNEPNNSVYIHCYYGKGRSSCVVVAYLMKKYEISLESALRWVKYVNSRTHINYNQMTLLKKFETYINS